MKFFLFHEDVIIKKTRNNEDLHDLDNLVFDSYKLTTK